MPSILSCDAMIMIILTAISNTKLTNVLFVTSLCLKEKQTIPALNSFFFQYYLVCLLMLQKNPLCVYYVRIYLSSFINKVIFIYDMMFMYNLPDILNY